jgi:hypothetical protein
MAYADHECCSVNEAELTILELGARMRQRMEEVSRIDAEFKNSMEDLVHTSDMPDEFEVMMVRCRALIARKRRDMVSLQYMIDSITADSVPSPQVMNHLASLVM